MAYLLGCEAVRLEFPTAKIFDSLTLGVNDGDRIGIVGRNGDGKSSLLQVLSGSYEPDDGRVVRTKGVRVGYLGQQDALDDEATLIEAVVGERPEYEWAGDPRIRSIMAELLGDIDAHAKVGTLSGGQRRRADLAPAPLGLFQLATEEGIQRQVHQLAILLKGLLDLAEEHRADDAAAAPHQRDIAIVQVPAMGLGG